VRAVLLIMDIDGFPFFLSSEIDCHAGLAGGPGGGVHLCLTCPHVLWTYLGRFFIKQTFFFSFFFFFLFWLKIVIVDPSPSRLDFFEAGNNYRYVS
jgi:hypothetical protein